MKKIFDKFCFLITATPLLLIGITVQFIVKIFGCIFIMPLLVIESDASTVKEFTDILLSYKIKK